MDASTPISIDEEAFDIQIQGLVQGVGFRPRIYKLARRYGIRGRVSNNGKGVHILLAGKKENVRVFIAELNYHHPPLAHVTAMLPREISLSDVSEDTFVITDSQKGAVQTGMVPDAATCSDCLEEIFDPLVPRYRYPFTNCIHCGPRLTIQTRIPYDRASTTMSAFALCDSCVREYHDPEDRRFHAQPIACPVCGPRVWIERVDDSSPAALSPGMLDNLETVGHLLQQGHILAIKGLGGFQLACDATQGEAVKRLRELKHRESKPFALMARDLEVIRQFCFVREVEAGLLQSAAAPIVILRRRTERALAPAVAPGLSTYGFMLPNSPLHHLILSQLNQPIVLTSGNHSGEPQWVANDEAREHLKGIAEYFVFHNRGIAQRVDDSVVQVMDTIPRVMRRSRGYAPAPVWLPEGFEGTPAILAMGGELKNTFCFLKDGQALLSHHIGDLEDALTFADYQRALLHYELLFEHRPQTIAVDLHPEYLSSKLGRERAHSAGLEVSDIQHHHAHLAACLTENGVPLDAEPVLGVILDGLGYGEDGTIWGGEFLLADYASFTRVGTFKPVRMLGGVQAIKQPWRNTYAHIMAGMEWPQFVERYPDLPLVHFLEKKPLRALDQMARHRVNSPLASSCGRLFDAAAAAMGICPEEVLHEGQAAMEMEALVDPDELYHEREESAYSFSISSLQDSNLSSLEPLAMWRGLWDDLVQKTPIPVMAARFHKGLAKGICRMVRQCSQSPDGDFRPRIVALSGGVFQNQILFELVKPQLEEEGFTVLSHRRVPMNDGGLALGQATIAAARFLKFTTRPTEPTSL